MSRENYQQEVISDAIRKDILDLLSEIENRYGVKILYAVESGSRAWGFPSIDSDYDIRFIYHHPMEYYISAFDKKDQIQLAGIGDLDAAGWDVAKCMRLMYRGNASLYEWLASPIVYQAHSEVEILQHFAQDTFNPAPVFHHYLGLAKKKLWSERSLRHGKTFLYGVRAVLCANWIEQKKTAPPVLFWPLVELFCNPPIRQQITQLMQDKSLQSEGDVQKIPETLLLWAQALYGHLSEQKVQAKREGDCARYDDVMRAIVMS